MLVAANLTRTYRNGTTALRQVSAEFPPGSITVIVGGSGCGKSTLLRLLGGLDRPDTGEVLFDGQPIHQPHPAIGIVFQEPRLMPWLTNSGNVEFGLSNLPRAARRERAAAALTRLRLDGLGARWPKELSGGQAQRVAIARALVAEPSVLLLDEPFSALDSFTRSSLHNHLLDLWRDSGLTLVLVTHDLDEALVLADRILVMKPGPGQIAARFDVSLDRPRRRSVPAFEALREKIADIITSTAEPDHLATCTAVASSPR
ncbi:nitrate/sulfonate/bicarbonate ABC transporter ATP-binding protein [Aureimonas endophytica]|uniref:Nitrate/sulfonate/bicarbonate ABC transporter ATP-binding protein n=1 Tax=Aureimonas endophytica TaxID=2027858 RepID=A0A917E4Z4_9HYPH|nr:ABC transporter ATP-binding protein [Aureimonas endophytica]GGE03384.1 nitrate/sulfonate/bicarbonate ABC transporter ATP-binding protein [Aureimonas endophytica]